MTKLQDILVYILNKYPYEDDLSNARVTKMVYLSDWISALNFGKVISDIDWYFDSFGPFVHDVEDTAKERSDIFKLVPSVNFYGKKKIKFKLAGKAPDTHLSDTDKKSIDYTIKKTMGLSFNDFIDMVYSTHPVLSSQKFTYLDLLGKAQEYQALQA